MENIDYDALKKRGFLKQKQDGFFILRTRMPHGLFGREHLEKLAAISEKYARGFVHITTRQGIEIPYINLTEIDKVEKEIVKAGIQAGVSGPRLRTTTCCPGTNWCKSGLINTFNVYDRIEREMGIVSGMDLPHKFKIAISGCPNTCTRPQQSEIGIHGIVHTATADKANGYVVYLGGCGGRSPRMGFKLGKIFNEDEAVAIVARVVNFYAHNAKPRQRLALLIEEMGKENFLKAIRIP